MHLVAKLLQGDPLPGDFFVVNPFPDTPPQSAHGWSLSPLPTPTLALVAVSTVGVSARLIPPHQPLPPSALSHCVPSPTLPLPLETSDSCAVPDVRVPVHAPGLGSRCRAGP